MGVFLVDGLGVFKYNAGMDLCDHARKEQIAVGLLAAAGHAGAIRCPREEVHLQVDVHRSPYVGEKDGCPFQDGDQDGSFAGVILRQLSAHLRHPAGDGLLIDHYANF